MTLEELGRELDRLAKWSEDIATYGDVDPDGNALHVDTGTLLEEVQAQMERLVMLSLGREPEDRVPLIYRAGELEEPLADGEYIPWTPGEWDPTGLLRSREQD